ncbi:MAG TPA: ATP-binding protein [Bryobacteraceae bacterium]|nr:ATP-binding protein [Bryobacteraceae bacterium]
MQISKDTMAGRTIATIAYVAVIALLAAGVLLGVWTAREMNAVMIEQFNAQQMVIAQTAKARIEREIGEIKRELYLQAQALRGRDQDPRELAESLQESLVRLSESGVRRVEVVDRAGRRVFAGSQHGSWAERPLPRTSIYDAVSFASGEEPAFWVSPERAESPGEEIVFAVRLTPDASRLMVLHLNAQALLTSIVRPIHSGKTGYAWVIDQAGRFIYHPNPDFSGRDAFAVRDEKFPDISNERIHFIQKEKMLKGEQGTGWYYSAWHRGYTEPTKKLIAYCPVRIADTPPRFWAVAVVAPQSEVEDALRRGSLRLLLLQGVVVLAVILGAGALIWLENRWSSLLEARVHAKTAALTKSEEKYRSLVESAEDLIFTIDRSGCFQSLNTFTATFFGGTPESFVGRNLSSAFPESSSHLQAGLIDQVYRSGKSIREEFELPMGERSAWISANFMPVKTETGEVSAVLCIARDITETKSLQRQLVNAEKLASLGTLAAGVAHEINNPLGVILGFCELLLRKAEPGSQMHDDLATIERQGLVCKETVENLLSFARAENQRREFSDLNACIEDIAKIVRHLLEKNGIHLVMKLGDGLPPVKGDARQLQQVFLNLITNAMAAMASGGTLTIRSFLERSTRRAVAQFQDSGAGIPPEHIDHIFEPFFTTKPEGQGTGLGLFVSYGIVSSYGGTIECASTPATALGQQPGTTFTVKLPTGAA